MKQWTTRLSGEADSTDDQFHQSASQFQQPTLDIIWRPGLREYV